MKKIALINDLSGFGKCSLTAAIPVISALGIQACPLPTAILSAQTGFPSYYCDDYTDRMNYFTDEWKNMQETFDGIYSDILEVLRRCTMSCIFSKTSTQRTPSISQTLSWATTVSASASLQTNS